MIETCLLLHNNIWSFPRALVPCLICCEARFLFAQYYNKKKQGFVGTCRWTQWLVETTPGKVLGGWKSSNGRYMHFFLLDIDFWSDLLTALANQSTRCCVHIVSTVFNHSTIMVNQHLINYGSDQGIIDMNRNGNSANFFSYVCNGKKN